MKEDAPDHRKMKRLARLLKIPLPFANGIMERLWLYAGKYHPDGGIGRSSDEDIADACAVPVEMGAAELIEAMHRAGFLDALPACRYFIHDWAAHCTHYIHNKLANHQMYFADGSPPRIERLQGENRRKKAAEFYGTDVSAQNAAQTPPVSAQTPPVSAQTPPVSARTPPLKSKDISPVSAQTPTKIAHGPTNARARPTPTPTPTPEPKPTPTPVTFSQQQHCSLDSVVVAEALKPYGEISEASVRRFIASCLNGKHDYTESEIVGIIGRLGPTIGRRVKNPLGVLIAQVPGALPAYVATVRAEPEKAPSGPTCRGCGCSLAGRMSINGTCGDCAQKAQK